MNEQEARGLAEAVAHLRRMDKAGCGCGASSRFVLAALAEAQRERDALAKPAPILRRGHEVEDLLAHGPVVAASTELLVAMHRSLAAAQAEAANMRPVVEAALQWAEVAKRTGVGWGVSRDLIEAADAYRALAAPPSTAATPEGK